MGQRLMSPGKSVRASPGRCVREVDAAGARRTALGGAEAAGLLALQRSAGNRAVVAALATGQGLGSSGGYVVQRKIGPGAKVGANVIRLPDKKEFTISSVGFSKRTSTPDRYRLKPGKLFVKANNKDYDLTPERAVEPSPSGSAKVDSAGVEPEKHEELARPREALEHDDVRAEANLTKDVPDVREVEASYLHAAGDNWNTVKQKHLDDEQVMRSIVAYRKRFVDGLISQLKDDPRFRDMKTRAAGSTALSSDYDITFMGPKGAEAVQEFNSRFRAHWGKEAGTVFDTNVYAEDVLPSKEVVKSGQDDISLLGLAATSKNVDARLDEGLQDVSSLVKVRKNMDRKSWDAFTSRILSRLSSDRELTSEANSRFSDANTIYVRTYVEQIITQLQAEPAGLARVKGLRAKGKSNVEIVEAVMGDDQGIAASNRVYEEKLLYAASLEEERNKWRPESRQWKTLTVDLRKAKADAMLFANEPYFSAGTLYHVVGNIQAKFGADLSPAALFQSLQENYGDTLKELHHLHGKPWPTVAVKSSKYVWRMLDAAAALKDKGIAIGVDVVKLRDAAKVALAVRQGESGTPEDATAALSKAGVNDLDGLEAVLATVAADANVAFREAG